MLINHLSMPNVSRTLSRFVTLLTVGVALFAAGSVVSAQTKKPKPAANPLSKISNGIRVTVNSVERADSITNFLDKIEPPEETMEIVRVNMTVKYIGKGDSITFTHFDLIDIDGKSAISILDDGRFNLRTEIMYPSKDNPSLSKDVYFVTTKKDAKLKTFNAGDLEFDISKLKVTKQDTFRRRGL